MNTLMISEILKNIRQRNKIAVDKGYPDYSHMILWNCHGIQDHMLWSWDMIDFLDREANYIEKQNNFTSEELNLPIDQVLNDCFDTIFEVFEFTIEKDGDLYTVSDPNGKIELADGDPLLGYFILNLYHENKGEWFRVEAAYDGVEIDEDGCSLIKGHSTGSVNMSLAKNQNLSTNDVIKLWHLMGHCIQHMTTMLENIPANLFESGSVLFEELCLSHYKIRPDRRRELLKDIAIGIVDLKWHTAGCINEDDSVGGQDLIDIVKMVQDHISVDLCLDDFSAIIDGGKHGRYFSHALCRNMVENNHQVFIKMIMDSYPLNTRNSEPDEDEDENHEKDYQNN
jgi:Zn-dependent oligopeptidase